jgi:hypothetical protein
VKSRSVNKILQGFLFELSKSAVSFPIADVSHFSHNVKRLRAASSKVTRAAGTITIKGNRGPSASVLSPV